MEDEDFYDDYEGPDICDMCGQDENVCTCYSCGLMPDGTCSLAGTEFCDWDCKSK